MGEKDAQITIQGEHPQSSNPQVLLSRGCAPIPPASTTDQDHSEETDLGALFHQPGCRPTTDRAVTPQSTGESLLNILGRLGAQESSAHLGDQGTNLWTKLSP